MSERGEEPREVFFVTSVVAMLENKMQISETVLQLHSTRSGGRKMFLFRDE